MRRLALLFVALAVAGGSHAGAGTASTTTALLPAADVGLPFACDWSYDWEARCYRDDGPRLPVGGVDDKVWRAALRFGLGSIPDGAVVESAELRLYHDGTCIAPRLRSVLCGDLGYVLDVHRILSASWFSEREPEVEREVLATAVLLSGSSSAWLSWDVTEAVREWHEGRHPNHGLLVKLQDGDEAYFSGGPYLAASTFPDPALRARLVVSSTAG